MQNNKNLVSLNELAKISNSNKSRLTYYVSLGLVVPKAVIGRMQIFNKEESLEIIKKIESLQLKGFSLKEIKEKL